MTNKKGAFTLVELIVVITILAILGTIAFISLQGYSRDARNSVRISDMSRIKTSLELFQLDAGKYPEANDDFFTVTYSGALARTQGFFGEATFSNVEKLDKIPKDPLTDKKYIYSTTNTRQEFEIAGVMEGDQISFIGDQANAGDKTAILKITGTYNGKILKVSTGGIDYVLAIPSIINGKGFDIDDIIKNNYLAYDGYENLAAQYDGGTYNVLGDPNITLVNPNDYVVYSGNIGDLSDSTSIGTTARNDLLINLQKAYSGTTIANVGEIAEILNTTGTTEIELLASTIVNNDLGGSYIASSGNLTQTDPIEILYVNIDGSTTPYLSDSANGSARFSFDSGSIGNGVVLDSITGLYWQSDGIEYGTTTWDSAKAYCAGLTLGLYQDWRLPDFTELSSILDLGRINPSIDTNYFTSNSNYWTSSVDATLTSRAWVVTFGGGYPNAQYKTNNNYDVRCVR